MSHWYNRQGEPCHFVTGAGGASRPSTLADARKFGWMPGYSGVDRMIHNHFLEKWKKDQAVLAALTLSRREGESDEAYLRRIDTDGASRATEAAETGKAIHYAIEASFRAEAVPEAYRAHVDAVHGKLAEKFPAIGDWRSEKTFACRDGYGGAIDLHSLGHRIILDYKGADISPEEPKKRVAYSQHRQLAAYAHGLGWAGGTYRACNLFVSRTHPGYVLFHEWTADELAEGLDTFLHALSIWQNVNKFNTRWT